MFFRLHLYTCYIKFFFSKSFSHLLACFRRANSTSSFWVTDFAVEKMKWTSFWMPNTSWIPIRAWLWPTPILFQSKLRWAPPGVSTVFFEALVGSPYPLSFYCPYPSFCYSLTTSNSDLRLTIMLMDTTVWPSRAWSEGSLCLKHIFMFGSYLSITLRCAEHRWGGLCHAIGVLRK